MEYSIEFQFQIKHNGCGKINAGLSYFNDVVPYSSSDWTHFFEKSPLSEALENCSLHPYIESISEFLSKDLQKVVLSK